MIRQQPSSFSVLALLACLCLGSLVIFPLVQGTVFSRILPTPGVETIDTFEHVELDDDFVGAMMSGAITSILSASQSGGDLSGLHSSYFAPQTPPPNPA